MTQKLRTECALLSQALQSNRRPRVYRHHRFYQDAIRAARAIAKLDVGTSTMKKHHSVRERRWLHAHHVLQRAVESATQELAAQRIDTIALCLLVVAVCSRMGCIVGDHVLNKAGAASCEGRWGDAYVEALGQRSRAPRTTKAAAPATPAAAGSGKTQRRSKRSPASRVKRTKRPLDSLGELISHTLKS